MYHEHTHNSTHWCIKVCHVRRWFGRPIRVGLNTTGSDCLCCKLRTKPTLTLVTRDLTIPANSVCVCEWVRPKVCASSFMEEVSIVTLMLTVHPPLHSDTSPRFCFQRWVVSHTLRCSHADKNHSHCRGQKVRLSTSLYSHEICVFTLSS